MQEVYSQTSFGTLPNDIIIKVSATCNTYIYYDNILIQCLKVGYEGIKFAYSGVKMKTHVINNREQTKIK